MIVAVLISTLPFLLAAPTNIPNYYENIPYDPYQYYSTHQDHVDTSRGIVTSNGLLIPHDQLHYHQIIDDHVVWSPSQSSVHPSVPPLTYVPQVPMTPVRYYPVPYSYPVFPNPVPPPPPTSMIPNSHLLYDIRNGQQTVVSTGSNRNREYQPKRMKMENKKKSRWVGRRSKSSSSHSSCSETSRGGSSSIDHGLSREEGRLMKDVSVQANINSDMEEKERNGGNKVEEENANLSLDDLDIPEGLEKLDLEPIASNTTHDEAKSDETQGPIRDDELEKMNNDDVEIASSHHSDDNSEEIDEINTESDFSQNAGSIEGDAANNNDEGKSDEKDANDDKSDDEFIDALSEISEAEDWHDPMHNFPETNSKIKEEKPEPIRNQTAKQRPISKQRQKPKQKQLKKSQQAKKKSQRNDEKPLQKFSWDYSGSLSAVQGAACNAVSTIIAGCISNINRIAPTFYQVSGLKYLKNQVVDGLVQKWTMNRRLNHVMNQNRRKFQKALIHFEFAERSGKKLAEVFMNFWSQYTAAKMERPYLLDLISATHRPLLDRFSKAVVQTRQFLEDFDEEISKEVGSSAGYHPLFTELFRVFQKYETFLMTLKQLKEPETKGSETVNQLIKAFLAVHALPTIDISLMKYDDFPIVQLVKDLDKIYAL